MNKIHPKLTLIGAGPGDPELITLKAVKALEAADVVLYDALLDDVLLEYAPQAIKRYVGKRSGQHSLTQDEINQQIVLDANKYGHVVRLKGGDPFVFGRGLEEATFANKYHIPVSVIPGISSSIAVPAYSGISLTQRGISRSFWVLTGTTAESELASDIALAAKSSATVVVLMGMNKLTSILNHFSLAGKQDLPVAIIQNGCTDKERAVFGTVSDIASKAQEQQIGAPAIIVLGEVVKHREVLRAQLLIQELIPAEHV